MSMYIFTKNKSNKEAVGNVYSNTNKETVGNVYSNTNKQVSGL